jgi:hypothetical protein
VYSPLTSPQKVTRWLILQKARGQKAVALLPLLVSTRFQVLFHSARRGSFHLSLTVLVHYRSLKVFSLGEWTPQLPTGLACPVVLKILPGVLMLFAYGTLTLSGRPFQCRLAKLSSSLSCVGLWPHFAALITPLSQRLQAYTTSVWALSLSLATTREILSFPGGTKMFQFPPCPPLRLCVQRTVTGHSPGRVPPFGYLRIKARRQLPEAFRSLLRPSSAFSA